MSECVALDGLLGRVYLVDRGVWLCGHGGKPEGGRDRVVDWWLMLVTSDLFFL